MTKRLKPRTYKSQEGGAILLATSTIFLVLGYVTRYIMFEAASIIFMLLGVVLLFAETEPQIDVHSASRAVASVLSTVSDLTRSLGIEGRPFYIPSQRSPKSVKMVFTKGGLEPEGSVEYEKDTGGLSLTPLGQELFQLYDEHLNLSDKDLEFVLTWLPRIVVEDLHLAETLEMERDGDEVTLNASRAVFRSICQQATQEDGIYKQVGCPLCSSVAETLAYVTGRAVSCIGCKYVEDASQIRYRLGREVVKKVDAAVELL